MACGGRGSGGGSIAPAALTGLDAVEDVVEAFVVALGGFLDAEESFRLIGRGLGGIAVDESGDDAGTSGRSTRRGLAVTLGHVWRCGRSRGSCVVWHWIPSRSLPVGHAVDIYPT